MGDHYPLRDSGTARGEQQVGNGIRRRRLHSPGLRWFQLVRTEKPVLRPTLGERLRVTSFRQDEGQSFMDPFQDFAELLLRLGVDDYSPATRALQHQAGTLGRKSAI